MRKQGDIHVKEYMVECRFEDGTLNVKDDLPKGLTMVMTENQICDFYFRHHPETQSVCMVTVRQWLADQGVHYRAKTW